MALRDKLTIFGDGITGFNATATGARALTGMTPIDFGKHSRDLGTNGCLYLNLRWNGTNAAGAATTSANFAVELVCSPSTSVTANTVTVLASTGLLSAADVGSGSAPISIPLPVVRLEKWQRYLGVRINRSAAVTITGIKLSAGLELSPIQDAIYEDADRGNFRSLN